jgi:photosystem II stability/assembly factor-like uncharacterized protein
MSWIPCRLRSLALLTCLSALGPLGAPATAQTMSGVAAEYPSSLFSGLAYRMVGPSRGGRVTAVAGHRATPGTFFMGATGGGVWKTADYGQSWTNVSDGYFATGSIGAIRVADSDPRIVYVGTGSDGIRSNVIAGRGVYKSTDGGASWDFVGLRDVGQIGAVLIHPSNPDIVYVAAIGHAFAPSRARGVYRSTDGGRSWQQVLFVSDSTGAVDLEFAPDDPTLMYASMWRVERKPWTIISGAREGGVYRSADGGESWQRLTGGLPAGLVGKSDLAVSPADPNRLYVLIEADSGAGLYRSDDRGERFALVSTQPGILNRPFYYTNVDADPKDADVVYVNNEGFFRSADGGSSFRRVSTPHGDNHDMWIDPSDSDVFIQSNDGGANVTRDGGRTWSTQHNQPTAELYQVDVDDQFPYWLYAGQQDNSTIAVPSLAPYGAPGGATAHWLDIGGCETGPAVPKPGDPTIVFANCKGRFGRYSKATGQEMQFYVGAANIYGHNPADLTYRFQRVSPIEVSPHDPSVVYHGSQYVHVTRDEGRTWETISPDLTAFELDKQVASGAPITRDITGEEYYSTLYVIEESPLERGVIWTGANDGPIHVTRDGGTTWTDVTPPDLPPGGRVQNIDPSPHDAARAYVAVYRYLLGDWQPYLYRTADYGRTWIRLTDGTNGIPEDCPTRVVREDPDRAGLLYAGTEFGMFISFDDGNRWQPFQLNLPVTPVTDIAVYRQDLLLATMGRSFWILDDVTPLHEIADGLAQDRHHLFTPRRAYRLRYSSFGRGSAEPEYPPPGVTIDYYLAEPVRGELRLEILDTAGTVVQTIAGSAGAAQDPDAPGTGRGFGLRSPQARLDATPGMHRFVWDMRRAAPGDRRTGRPGRGGPLATPGHYRARLTAGDWDATQEFELAIDPRVAADGVTKEDLEAQLTLSLLVLELQGAADSVLSGIRRLRSGAGVDQGVQSELAALEREMVTAQGISYPQPMLLDQIQYVSAMLSRADQPPGGEAYTRYRELGEWLSRITLRLHALGLGGRDGS